MQLGEQPECDELDADEDQHHPEQQQRTVGDRLVAEEPHVPEPAGDQRCRAARATTPIKPKICSGRVE